MVDKGIDKDGLKKQILALKYYSDEVKSKLENINSLFSKLIVAYKGEGSERIIARYGDISNCYINIYSKLISYYQSLESTIIEYETEDDILNSIKDS